MRGDEPSGSAIYDWPVAATDKLPLLPRRSPEVEGMLARHPSFRQALLADTRFVSLRRGRPLGDAGAGRVLLEAARLALVTDAFAAQIAIRLRAALLRRRVPVLPGILHRFAMVWAQVSVSEGVVIEPGISIAHGQIVLAGLVRIGSGTMIAPFVTVGLAAGNFEGATIGRDVQIGTGTRIIGPVRIGDGVRIGANAAVIDDLPDGATAVGVPAAPLP